MLAEEAEDAGVVGLAISAVQLARSMDDMVSSGSSAISDQSRVLATGLAMD